MAELLEGLAKKVHMDGEAEQELYDGYKSRSAGTGTEPLGTISVDNGVQIILGTRVNLAPKSRKSIRFTFIP